MSTMEELEARIAALEARVGEEARLRASVDRDVADHQAKIAATHHLVQALSITQSQQTEELRLIRQSLEHQDGLLLRTISMLQELLRRGPDGAQ